MVLGGDAPDAYEEQARITAGRIADGSVGRLRKASGSQTVYTLFCNSCKLDGKTGGYVCGHDIACENINNTPAGDGFDIIRLYPSTYAVFDCFFDGGMTPVQAYQWIDDLYWGEWLKNNPYESMIETTTGADTPGIAVISLDEPPDPGAESFHITTWFPIRQKDNDKA